ncbi:WbqC family protein [Flavobacteriaceae bacterium]|nr:WbqC family protein [Flavobacteriaceae bacterium]
MELEIFSSYIPNVATLAVLAQHECVNIQTQACYQKQTYRNRTQIAGANGVLNLSIPIEKGIKGTRLVDQEVQISYDEMWQNNHWKSFVSAYQSSPFFEFYQDELEAVFFKKQKKLLDFNMDILQLIMDWLELDTQIKISTEQPLYNPTGEALISAKKATSLHFPKYIQVFESKLGFISNLNALDLICCLGPESPSYLKKIDVIPILALS